MSVFPIRLGLNTLEVHISPFIRPGMVAHTLALGGRDVYVRHLSELLTLLAGATWHPSEERCPTWTEATECRCMLGTES